MAFKGMRVNCSQRWEDMRPITEGERFCDRCAKPVIDFTDWDDDALHAWFAARPESCGQFNLEQVRPDLLPVPGVPRELLRGAFAALAALSLSGAVAQRPQPVPQAMEQVPSQDAPSTTPRAVQAQEDGERCWAEKESLDSAPVKRRRPRYYLSWSFPFVHKARKLRGKIRITGCPSF